uniref:MRG domain-containing protein n=1 Tax=Parastrongyloides trichosuri TaxID=131310 RepID=A0A0N4ZX13_PARTI
MEEYVKNLKDGDETFCLHEGKYYKVKILSISGIGNGKCFKIHYDGWNSRHDEKISFNQALKRLSYTNATPKPIVEEEIEVEKEKEKIDVKPIDSLIDRESLSLEILLAYALFGEKNYYPSDFFESQETKNNNIIKFVKYKSITSQYFNNFHFWNLPKYFTLYKGFPFDEEFICSEDKSFLEEIIKKSFNNKVKYYEHDVSIIETFDCIHCSTIPNNCLYKVNIKEQISSNTLYVPRILRKMVKKNSKLKKEMVVLKLPVSISVFKIIYDFYNEEIREKIINDICICPLFKIVAPTIEEIFKKLMVLRLLFDMYLPSRLLYRHERLQLTDMYDPKILTNFLEQDCYIEYSRIYGYEHFVRFFITLKHTFMKKVSRRDNFYRDGSSLSDEQEEEDEEEENDDDCDSQSKEFEEESVDDPLEGPGLFILCEKILNFLIEKKDKYSPSKEDYTFLDPHLVREIDDATTFSGRRLKE